MKSDYSIITIKGVDNSYKTIMLRNTDFAMAYMNRKEKKTD